MTGYQATCRNHCRLYAGGGEVNFDRRLRKNFCKEVILDFVLNDVIIC